MWRTTLYLRAVKGRRGFDAWGTGLSSSLRKKGIYGAAYGRDQKLDSLSEGRKLATSPISRYINYPKIGRVVGVPLGVAGTAQGVQTRLERKKK